MGGRGEPGPNVGGAGAATSGGGAGAGAVASGGSPECSRLPDECSASDDMVYIGGVELRHPGPGSCGDCGSACVECAPLCTLPIRVTPRCTGNRVHLSVCSMPGGRGTCVNTLAENPYYVDEAGKRWSVISLEADEPTQFTRAGRVMASLTLRITDGPAFGVIPLTVLACNTDPFYLLPC